MSVEIDQLLGVMDRAYDKRSWHGTNLRGSIRGLSPTEAARRPGRGRHNIWEIVVHAAYWKYAVRRRLTGEKRGGFELEGSNWFRRPARSTRPDAAQWAQDVRLLERTHESLRSAVEHVPASSLHRRNPGSTETNFSLIAGIAAHDLYHAGQIQLIKRLVRGS
jgi:hypothetical protein